MDIKTVSFIMLTIELILLALMIFISLNKKIRSTLKQLLIILAMILVLVVYWIFVNGDISGYKGGITVTSIEYANKVTSGDNVYYNVGTYDGSKYIINDIGYSYENKLILDCKIIRKNVFGIKIYQDGDILLVKPKDVNLDTMSQSEKRSYFTNEEK